MTIPVFPRTMAEVLAATVAQSQRLGELPQVQAIAQLGIMDIARALQADAAVMEWLEIIRPHAFVKGVVADALPRTEKFGGASRIRSLVMDAIFAECKEGKEGWKSVPGGKAFYATEADFLSGYVQAGGDDGSADLRAVELLRSISGEYTIDEREVEAADAATAFQKQWAHGENPLQPFYGQLAELGIFAESLEDAAEQLIMAGDPDFDLRKEIEGRIEGSSAEPIRQYGNFRAKAVQTADTDPLIGLRPLQVPRHLLDGATLCLADWDSLKVPHVLKAEAFDRVVAMWVWKLKSGIHTKVVANTDDLAGKAALTAAKTLGIRTVSFSLGNQADVRFFMGVKPSALAFAVREVAQTLGAACERLFTLGQSDLITQTAQIVEAWAKPSKHDEKVAERRGLSLEDYRAEKAKAQKTVTPVLGDWFQHNGLDIQAPVQEQWVAPVQPAPAAPERPAVARPRKFGDAAPAEVFPALRCNVKGKKAKKGKAPTPVVVIKAGNKEVVLGSAQAKAFARAAAIEGGVFAVPGLKADAQGVFLGDKAIGLTPAGIATCYGF